MAEERIVVHVAGEGRDADILIMQLSRAGIEAAKEPGQESDQPRRWQVSVVPSDEYHAREIVAQFEQDRRDLRPQPAGSEPGTGRESNPSDDSLHNPTTVYSAASLQQAYFLKDLLIESGIRAIVSNELLHRGSGAELVGLPTAVEVVVAAKDAPVGRQLALEFDQRTSALADPVEVYSAGSRGEALAVVDTLTQAGIPAGVREETIHASTVADKLGRPKSTMVIVPREDLEAAQRITGDGVDFSTTSSEVIVGLESGPSVIDILDPWPLCPRCDTRRTTQCPICPTSGTDFERADPEFAGTIEPPGHGADGSGGCGSNCSCGHDSQEVAGQSANPESATSPGPETCPPRLALICPTCNEPFIADFPRRCEWCGQEFADGYELEDHIEREPISNQAMIVILGLVTLALVACAYFAWIL